MSQRRQKRIRETVRIVEEETGLLKSDEKIAAKSDAELFLVDRIGSKTVRRKLIKEVEKSENAVVSKTEKTLLEKFQQKLDSVCDKRKLYNENETIRDLWNEDAVSNTGVNQKPTVKNQRTKRSRIALPGQSYNPSQIDHQNALAEALALEIAKKDATEQQRTDSLTGCFNNDVVDTFRLSEDEDEDGDDDDDDVNADKSEVNSKRKKQQSKLTRAQRNKIKTRNAASFENNKEKFEKNLNQSIDTLPQVLRTIESEEQLTLTRQQLKLRNKQLAEENLLKLTYDDARSIPLSDELSGSLRTIIPKGVTVLDRTHHMQQSGDLMSKDRRKRKAYEKPHGGKNVVWIPKYKTTAISR